MLNLKHKTLQMKLVDDRKVIDAPAPPPAETIDIAEVTQTVTEAAATLLFVWLAGDTVRKVVISHLAR